MKRNDPAVFVECFSLANIFHRAVNTAVNLAEGNLFALALHSVEDLAIVLTGEIILVSGRLLISDLTVYAPFHNSERLAKLDKSVMALALIVFAIELIATVCIPVKTNNIDIFITRIIGCHGGYHSETV